MDREIPKDILRKEAMKKWLVAAGVFLAVAVAVGLAIALVGDSVKASELRIATAEIGPLESSVSASGKLVPLHEQTIVSPVATRILEIYCIEGDSVEEGQSLLRLDLQSAETNLRRLRDEMAMKNNELEQAGLSDKTSINNLEMQIRVKEMSVSHLQAEVANEKRLDSIGSGTGDRIREAELAYSTGLMELEQLRLQLENEKKMRASSYRSKQLESSISARNLQEMERTIEDARVKAPSKGIVTWLSKTIGGSVSAGEKLAVVSDLGHFKVVGEIGETNSGKLSVGAPVRIRINRKSVNGRISTISPQSENGLVEFIVFIDNDSDKLLRSGLRADLNVVYDTHDNAVRIPNGAYYKGEGLYTLFIKTSDDKLERRDVTLGDSNFDFVEVRSGIKPGEEVVISDMKAYKNKQTINIKN